MYLRCSTPSAAAPALSSSPPAAATRRRTAGPGRPDADTCTATPGAGCGVCGPTPSSLAPTRPPWCNTHVQLKIPDRFRISFSPTRKTHSSLLSNARYSSIRPSTSITLDLFGLLQPLEEPGSPSSSAEGDLISAARLPCTFSLSRDQRGHTVKHSTHT